MPYNLAMDPQYPKSEPSWIESFRKLHGPWANADGHPVFRFFLNEICHWQILEANRRIAYSYFNGVMTAVIDARLARQLVDDLEPDYKGLFSFSDVLNSSYDFTIRDPKQPGWRKGQVKAFSQALRQALTGWLEADLLLRTDEGIDAACALAFCTGALDQFGSSVLAQDTEKRACMRADLLEPYPHHALLEVRAPHKP